MTLGQVAEAVLVGRDPQLMDPGDQFRDVHDLLDLCSSFVCLDTTQPSWGPFIFFPKQFNRDGSASDADLILRLAHSSVKEYMLSDRTNISSLSMHRLTSGIAQHFMAEVCLIYLNRFNDESSISDEVLERHHFLVYVAYHWYLHYDEMPAEEENNVVNLFLSFINTHDYGYAYQNWVAVNTLRYIYPYPRLVGEWLRPLATLSSLGAHRAVRTIIEHAAEVHEAEDMIREGLHWASREGHEAVVRVILDAGATLDRAWVLDASSLSRVLCEATDRGHTEVIELLISKGASAERLDYSFVSRVAAGQGKLHLVKLFLDWTTTNWSKIGVFYTALQAAITARQSSIVRYLLERSNEIDITAREDLYFATLKRAYFERDVLVVRSLVIPGLEARNIRKAKLKVLDTSLTPRTKLVILQRNDAGIDPLLERNHERDYIPYKDAYWKNAVEVEDTIKETLLEERKLLEEEELIEETEDLLQRIRSLSTVAIPAIETGSDGMI